MLSYGLNVEHHVLPGLYVSFIYNQAGALVRWFRDTFASADCKLLREGESIYEVLAAEIPSGPTRLLTLPYFEITGPPGFVSEASGVIVGLKTSTTRGEILKSIMECVTFYGSIAQFMGKRAVENAAPWKSPKAGLSHCAWKSRNRSGISTFSTAPATTV